MGGARDKRPTQVLTGGRSLTLNGGAFLPSGGEITVWCATGHTSEFVSDAQMMLLQVGGFSS